MAPDFRAYKGVLAGVNDWFTNSRNTDVTKHEICAALVKHRAGRRITMTMGSHLQELRKKHESLSERVETAQRSPAKDDLQVNDLKKQKLRLKEEIHRLSGV